jgi:hypothetical protein
MPLDLGVYERTILKRTLKNQDRKRGPDTSDSELGQVAGFCENGNEHSCM